MGDFYERPALVQQQPAAREIKAGFVFGRSGALLVQHRRVYLLYVDLSVYRLGCVGDIQQLARGLFRMRIEAVSAELHASRESICAS